MAKMRRRRNDLVPVSCLPQEVLGGVFVQAVDGREDPMQDFVDVKYPTRISTLAKVSSSWNETMLATPEIWCNMSTKHPPSFIRAALRRSATGLLNVELDFADTDGNAVAEEAMLRIVAQMSRWRSAKISSASTSDIDNLAYSSATKLQYLVIECGESEQESFQLFGGGTPALKHLNLSCVPLCPPMQIVTALQTLVIKNMGEVNADTFFTALRACPALEKLEVHFVQFLHPTTQDIQSPVNLPELQILRLFDIPADSLNAITLCLNCPAVQEVLVRPDPIPFTSLPSHAITADYFLPTFRFILRLISTMNSTDPVAIYMFGGWTLFRRIRVKPVLVGFEIVASEAVSIALLEYLRGHMGPRVEFVNLMSGPETDRWHALDHWSSLHTVCESGASEAVTYLTNPTVEHGVMRWHLPHLTYVWLTSKNYNNAEEVLQMVRSRKGRCHPTGGGVTLNLPAPFRNIHITNGCPMDMVTFLKIQNALGAEGEVVWDEKPQEGQLPEYNLPTNTLYSPPASSR